MKKITLVLVLLIVILGAWLRFLGFDWGLQQGKYYHGHSYYPDEQYVIGALRGMNPSKLDFKPRDVVIWARGTFTTYLTGAVIYSGKLLHLIAINSNYDFYKSNPAELKKLYLAGRVITFVFAILSMILIYLLGKKMYNAKVGLLSAFFLAVIPVHVVYSHFGSSTDIPVAFWNMLIFLVSISMLGENKMSQYILAGLFIGISSNTKYNSVFSIVVPVTAHFMHIAKTNEFSIKKIINLKLVLLFVASLVGFIIVNPYNLINISELKGGLLYAAEILHRPDPTPDCCPGQSVLAFYFTNAFYYGVGIPLSLMFICGIIYAVTKRKNADVMAIIWLIVWMCVLCFMTTWKTVRWITPLLPCLCLLASRFIIEFIEKSKKTVKIISYAVVFMVSAYTFIYSFSYSRLMSGKDVRDLSSEWIENNIPENSTIGIPTVPFFYDPAIIQMHYWYSFSEPFFKDIKKYRLVVAKYSADIINKEKPEYFILSDYVYYPKILKFKNYTSYLDTIEDDYQLVKSFDLKPQFLGFHPVSGFYPHDWRIFCPEIFIFRRKK